MKTACKNWASYHILVSPHYNSPWSSKGISQFQMCNLYLNIGKIIIDLSKILARDYSREATVHTPRDYYFNNSHSSSTFKEIKKDNHYVRFYTDTMPSSFFWHKTCAFFNICQKTLSIWVCYKGASSVINIGWRTMDQHSSSAGLKYITG